MTLQPAQGGQRFAPGRATTPRVGGRYVREGETQSFYNEFFDIFGVRRRTVARYEEHVRRLDNTSGFIDLFWPGVLLVGYFRVNERFRSLESTCNFHPPRMCSFRPALTLGLAAA